MTKSPVWPSLFSMLLAVLLAANYFGIMGDLDWSWQIRTGEQIVQSGSLRTSDEFTYTINGALLHDFEWLYEVLLYGIWSVFGLAGLKFVKMSLVAATWLLLATRLKREGVRWHGIAIALFISFWILAGSWNLRALYITTIGLLLVSGWLHDHCLGRKPLTWWLPAVMLAWSNLHPGVITGQGLLAGAIGWEWLNRWLKFNPPLAMTQLKRLTIIGGLGILATFLSPDPIDRLLYPFRPELAHPIQQYFVEMRPLHSFFWQLPVITVPIYLLALSVFLTVLLRPRLFRGWEIALLLGLTLLANLAVRVLMDWTLIMLALGVPKMRDIFADAVRSDRRSWPVRLALRVDRFFRRLLDSRMFRFQPLWPAVVVGGLFLLTLMPGLANSLPIQNGPTWPVATLDFVENAGLEGRFFASPDNGAYIGWRLKAKAQVYTDTRGFFFRPELLEDSILIPEKGPDWRRRLEHILANHPTTDYFLLGSTGAPGALWRDLQPVIDDDPLYCDDQCVLLRADQVRKGLARLPLQTALTR